MITWPITDDLLAELRQVIVELAVSAEGADLLELVHDATVPVPGSPRTRKVELFVRSSRGTDRRGWPLSKRRSGESGVE